MLKPPPIIKEFLKNEDTIMSDPKKSLGTKLGMIFWLWLIVCFIVYVTSCTIREARSEELPWIPAAVVFVGGQPIKALPYTDHAPFDTEAECDAFRASDPALLEANERLEAKVQRVAPGAEVRYACAQVRIITEESPNADQK